MHHFDLDRMYCAAIKRGEIFLVANHDHSEENLMIIVQDNVLNERLSTVLAIPIAPHHEAGGHFKNQFLLKPSETSLGEPAVGLPQKIEAVDRRRLLAKTGELAPDRLRDLFDVLDINLGRFRD
ncbi:MAG: type II toxin-antitoxin system PemK/MazF family toxin [Candidatus Magasanikbacteria bacterium]|nr:type II toxin-antitoxin system PemK/MazF family toxin [Candidatus Magasanikbacteria bacterium]